MPMSRRAADSAQARPTDDLKGRAALLAAVLLVCSPSLRAQDLLPPGRLDLVLSLEQSRGFYREATATRIRNAAFIARYRTAAWVVEAQLPFLEVSTAGDAGGLPGAAQAGASNERGIGDVWLKLGLVLRDFDVHSPGFDLTLKLKAPTGDASRGLGSGGTDLAAQLEVTQPVGSWLAFGHVGWRHTGDVAGYVPYRDPWYGQLGISRPVSGTVEVGGFVDVREAIGRLGPLREATAYAAWRHADQRLQAYVSRGYAPASADWALGLNWRTRF